MRGERHPLEQQLRLGDGVVFEFPAAGRRIDGGGPGMEDARLGDARQMQRVRSHRHGLRAGFHHHHGRAHAVDEAAPHDFRHGEPAGRIGAFGERPSFEVGQEPPIAGHMRRDEGAEAHRLGALVALIRILPACLQPRQYPLFDAEHRR